MSDTKAAAREAFEALSESDALALVADLQWAVEKTTPKQAEIRRVLRQTIDAIPLLAARPAPAAEATKAEPVPAGFVRLSKQSDHGKPYRAWEHAKEQARSDVAPAIASLIVRDICELEPADHEASDAVSVYVGDIETILRERLTAPAAIPEGFALVPIEPTPAMAKAAADAWLECGNRLFLNKAMAAARAAIAKGRK